MNNGLKKYNILIQVDQVTGVPTGITKLNSPLDTNYIPPLTDYLSCPIPTTTTTTTTSTTTTTTTEAPSFLIISNIVVEPLKTQVFQIGENILIGGTYFLYMYGHEKSTVALISDDQISILSRLVDLINNTTEAQWRVGGKAPMTSVPGFPPTASLLTDKIQVIVNYEHGFISNVY